jgi:hypothetical protein
LRVHVSDFPFTLRKLPIEGAVVLARELIPRRAATPWGREDMDHTFVEGARVRFPLHTPCHAALFTCFKACDDERLMHVQVLHART